MNTSGEVADLMVKEGIQITESAVKLTALGAKNLAAIIMALCMAGAYSYKNDITHVGVAILFGVIGYIFYKFNVPSAPFILASILGGMIESNYMNSLVYTGSPLIFLQRPVSLVLVIVTTIFLLWPFISGAVRKIKATTK